MTDATVDVIDRLQVSLPERVGSRRPDVRWAAPGDRRRPGRGLRVEGRHPRRADGGARCARSRRVLDLISRLRAEGQAVIVISHALDHVTEVADRAVVMRRGRKVGEEVPSPESQQRIVAMIVGSAA